MRGATSSGDCEVGIPVTLVLWSNVQDMRQNVVITGCVKSTKDVREIISACESHSSDDTTFRWLRAVYRYKTDVTQLSETVTKLLGLSVRPIRVKK